MEDGPGHEFPQQGQCGEQNLAKVKKETFSRKGSKFKKSY